MTDEWQKPDRGFFVQVVLVGLIVFAVAVSIGIVTGSPSGSVADWVAAIATVATFLAAVVAAWFAAQALRVERHRDWVRDQEQRRNQATRVAVWAGLDWEGKVTTSWGASSPEVTTVSAPVLPISMTATIRNASDLPLTGFDIVVYVVADFSNPNSPLEIVGKKEVGFVLPDSNQQVEVLDAVLQGNLAAKLMGRPNASDGPDENAVRIGWAFRDNARIHWEHVPGVGLRERRTT